MNRRAWNGLLYLLLRVMKRGAEEFVKFGTTEAMTARLDYDGPSRGPSTQPRFDRFLVIKILLLLGFVFIIKSLENLVFGVRLFGSRLFNIRLFDCYNLDNL